MSEPKFNKELLYKLKAMYAKDGLTKVEEKEIAKAIGMSAVQFSRDKNTGRIPYKYLIPYCLDNNVNINWLLDSNSNLLYEIENTMYLKRWTECRKNYLQKLIGKYQLDNDCEKVKVFHRHNTKNLKTDLDIYNFFYDKDKVPCKYKYKIVFVLLFAFLIGYLIGSYF